MDQDGHFSAGESRHEVAPSRCGQDQLTILVDDLRVKPIPWDATWYRNDVPAERQPGHGPKIRSRVVISFRGRAMTILGNLSRTLNRMSGGPRGQTLCARVAERRPDCWFCRLMSRIVEPNHCAIELAYWVKHGTPAEAEWRIDDR